MRSGFDFLEIYVSIIMSVIEEGGKMERRRNISIKNDIFLKLKDCKNFYQTLLKRKVSWSEFLGSACLSSLYIYDIERRKLRKIEVKKEVKK